MLQDPLMQMQQLLAVWGLGTAIFAVGICMYLTEKYVELF